MNIDVKTLDNEICSDCPRFTVEEYQRSYYNGDTQITADTHYRCQHLDVCLELKRHIERKLKWN